MSDSKPLAPPKLPTPEEINKLMPKKWKELTDFNKDMNKLIKSLKDCKTVLTMDGLNPVVKNMVEFLYMTGVISPEQKHVDFFRDKMMPEVLLNRDDTVAAIRKDKFNEVYRETFEASVKINEEQLKKLPHDQLSKADEKLDKPEAPKKVPDSEENKAKPVTGKSLGEPSQ